MNIPMNQFFLAILFLILSHFPIHSEENPMSISVYGGPYINSDLIPISLYGDIKYKKSYIAMAGVNYEFYNKFSFVKFEVEGLIGKHFYSMNHFEAVGVVLARVQPINTLPLSFAFGEGLSYASQNPKLENLKKNFDLERGTFSSFDIESKPLLNYLALEMEYGFPDFNRFPRIFMRIHHRSGIWGTFCPSNPPCGSNFITYGFRIQM
jgi:hypothetical protein